MMPDSQKNSDRPSTLSAKSKRNVPPVLNPETPQPVHRKRISAIDALRGLVIVLMALDHSRDFFGDVRIRPEDVETTTTALFYTRWITHLCATTFVFLAGVSAWLHGDKLQSRRQLSWYLVTRGLWLIVLEFTVIRFGLLFALNLGPWMFIVIAAIGASMVLLGICCWLPRWIVLSIGLAIIFGHNIFDGVEASELGSFGWLWTLMMRPGYIPSMDMAVGYPVLPWFGVMAFGFGLSPWLTQGQYRRQFVLGLGCALVAGFLMLRFADVYGDSQKWDWQTLAIAKNAADTATGDDLSAKLDVNKTVFSFLATSKYPPSLLFVLMTLGPSLLIWALLDWLADEHWLVRFLKVFGSVPLFFYVLHFYLLHLGAWGLYWYFKGVLISPMQIDVLPEVPPEYGFNGPGWLTQVYIGWAVVVGILFPLCIWFRNRKRTGKSSVWSYL